MKLFGHSFHRHDNPWADAPAWAIELREMWSVTLALQEAMMAAIDDLKSAIADLTTALNDNNAEIDTLLTKITTPGTSDADVQAAVASIRALITDNTAEVAKARAAAP